MSRPVSVIGGFPPSSASVRATRRRRDDEDHDNDELTFRAPAHCNIERYRMREIANIYFLVFLCGVRYENYRRT